MLVLMHTFSDINLSPRLELFLFFIAAGLYDMQYVVSNFCEKEY